MTFPPKVKLPREQEDWEMISEGTRGYTQRMKVPGGWLYRTMVYGALAMSFVPGPAADPSPPPEVTP